MSKHTPGPWIVSADPLHFYSLTTVIGGKESLQKNGPPQQMIVQVGGFAEWQEAEANARLIAAAPELLEAAIELKDVCNRPSAARTRAEAWRKLDKAIAKAAGGQA